MSCKDGTCLTTMGSVHDRDCPRIVGFWNSPEAKGLEGLREIMVRIDRNAVAPHHPNETVEARNERRAYLSECLYVEVQRFLLALCWKGGPPL